MLAGVRSTWLGALAMVNLLTCSRDDPPRAAELVDALARRLARLPVADEVVERVTAVRDLELAVLALRRTEQRGADTGTGDRLALREERRPERRARAIANARRALVLDEVVERDSLAVDENAPELRLREVDVCSAGGLCAAGESKRRRARREYRRYGERGEQFDAGPHRNLLVMDARAAANDRDERMLRRPCRHKPCNGTRAGMKRFEAMAPAFPVEELGRGEPWPRAASSRTPQDQASRNARVYASAATARRARVVQRVPAATSSNDRAPPSEPAPARHARSWRRRRSRQRGRGRTPAIPRSVRRRSPRT